MPRLKQSASAQKLSRRLRRLRYESTHKPIWLKMQYINELQMIAEKENLRSTGEAAVLAIETYISRTKRDLMQAKSPEIYEVEAIEDVTDLTEDVTDRVTDQHSGRFLHIKKGECIDQATQTMPTAPDLFSCIHCKGTQPMKPMPPLAKIQPSGPQKKISPAEVINSETVNKKRVYDPLFKGPRNIKVINRKISKDGPLRREFHISQQSWKHLMQTGSNLGVPSQAAQPVQVALGDSSQLSSGCILPSQNLQTASSRNRYLQLLRVVPVQISQSNSMSSSLSRDATVIPPLVKLTTSFGSSSEESIIHDGINTTSSNLREVPSIADTLSFSDICGSSPVVPLEPAESMDHLESMPCVGFSQTKCIDEDDNAEDDIYDDGNVKLDDEKERIDLDTKPMEVKDPLETCIVKEEVLSDTDLPNLVHSEKEESLFDQMQDLEVGSDGKPQHSEPETYEDEEEEEYDEKEDDEEIDYEAQELKDPTYEPPSSRHLSKDREDKQRNSKGMSSTCQSVEDIPESDEEDKPLCRAKKRQTRKHKPVSKFPEACPLCFETYARKAEMTEHLQTHIPIEEGPEAIKDAVRSIESKFRMVPNSNFNMRWCEECKKFFVHFSNHFDRCHTNNSRYHVLCQECGKMIDRRYIKFHQLSHLKVDESAYVQCPECPSRFKHQEFLKVHIKRAHINKTVRKLPCSTCGKMFKSPHHLTRHEVIHSRVKPFQCTLCEKSFTQKSNLKIHMRQHTGDQPYACELCAKAFTNKVSLKNHKKKLHGIDWWKERESWNRTDPELTYSNETE